MEELSRIWCPAERASRWTIEVIEVPSIQGVAGAEAGIETECRDAFSRSKVEAGVPLDESLRAEYEPRRRGEVQGLG